MLVTHSARDQSIASVSIEPSRMCQATKDTIQDRSGVEFTFCLPNSYETINKIQIKALLLLLHGSMQENYSI